LTEKWTDEAQLSTYHEAVANQLQKEKRDAAVRRTRPARPLEDKQFV
jgi:hypothetical protein